MLDSVKRKRCFVAFTDKCLKMEFFKQLGNGTMSSKITYNQMIWSIIIGTTNTFVNGD